MCKIKKIKQEHINSSPLAKKFIEILIKDILHSNPKLELYKGLFVLKNEKKLIRTDNVDITFYPGFTTSFMETDKGTFLIVILQNKIIPIYTLLNYLLDKNYKDKNNHNQILNDLIGRSFKLCYSKKNYKIYDVLFHRNPTNQTFNYEGGTSTLVDYYQIIKKIKIRNEKQPIIVAKKKIHKMKKKALFIPELCYMTGLEENEVQDKKIMKQLSFYTKLKPNERVEKTNKFPDLLKKETKERTG